MYQHVLSLKALTCQEQDSKVYPGQCGGNCFHRDIKGEQREMKEREVLRTACRNIFN